ncbi:MAG: hypothetical protein ACREXK_09105 [Gammaproteobacteria bacterium]
MQPAVPDAASTPDTVPVEAGGAYQLTRYAGRARSLCRLLNR